MSFETASAIRPYSRLITKLPITNHYLRITIYASPFITPEYTPAEPSYWHPKYLPVPGYSR
jgi:hypothetical protein